MREELRETDIQSLVSTEKLVSGGARISILLSLVAKPRPLATVT